MSEKAKYGLGGLLLAGLSITVIVMTILNIAT